MSYTYLLYAPDGTGAALALQPGAAALRVIAPAEVLIHAVGAQHRDLAWEAMAADDGTISWFGRAQGCASAEFWVTTDRNGNATSLHATHIDRAAVDALAAALHLYAFDPQKGTVAAPA